MKAKALALLVVAAILLSGCASKKGDDDGDANGSGTSTSTKTGTGTATGTKSGSTTGTSTGSAGAGTMALNFTRATPNGAAPLSVNFTLNATFKGADGKTAKPASSTWTVHILSANSTNATNMTSTNGPTGTTLPANFTLNFTAAGNHTVFAKVEAPGYKSANATILIMVSAGGVAGGPMFFDGAEGDASQWTITETVYFVDNLAGEAPSQEFGTNHPSAASWAQVTDKKLTGAKSWHPGYSDFQRSRMVSVPIVVPASGGTLSYALTGGAEKSGGSVEGLFVLVGPKGGARTVIAHQEGTFADWTPFSFSVPGGEIQLEFRFDSDGSCSTTSNLPSNPALNCGEGAAGGGYWVDDIKVA